MRLRRLRRIAGVAVSCAAAAVATSACTSARNTLGTNSSPCYTAIPVAADAVHHRGHFLGIRLLSARQASTKRRLDALLEARAPKVKTVCVVAYEGTYSLSQVEEPFGTAPPAGTGPVAIAVVSLSRNRLIGTIVLRRVPLAFRHEVLGPLRRQRPPPTGPADRGSVPALALSAGRRPS